MTDLSINWDAVLLYSQLLGLFGLLLAGRIFLPEPAYLREVRHHGLFGMLNRRIANPNYTFDPKNPDA